MKTLFAGAYFFMPHYIPPVVAHAASGTIQHANFHDSVGWLVSAYLIGGIIAGGIVAFLSTRYK